MTCAKTGCAAAPGKHCRGYCDRHYRQRVRMGIYGWRDAATAREHVRALRQLGWTYEQIASEAGVSTWVPHKLVTGVTKRVWPESERAIRRLPLEPRGSHRGVAGVGTYRRVEALQWMGWSRSWIEQRIGLAASTLATYRSRGEPVSYRVAHAVAALYDEISHLPGPSKQTATKARKRGYAPPAAWDEDTIDNPRGRPRGVLRLIDGLENNEGEGAA